MAHPGDPVMSHPPVTVTAMNVGYLFSTFLGHLPVLAVLVAGFVLVATRRARIGARSALLAQLGLGVLVLSQLLQVLWSLAFPSLLSALDYSSSRYSVLTIVVGLILSLTFAGGIGLLVAAVVTRATTGRGFDGPGPAFGDPTQGFGPTQRFGPAQGFDSA